MLNQGVPGCTSKRSILHLYRYGEVWPPRKLNRVDGTEVGRQRTEVRGLKLEAGRQTERKKHMKQKQINSITGAIDSAQMIILGTTELIASVHLLRNPKNDVVTELTNTIMACGNLEQAKQVKATRRTALFEAITDSQKFIRMVRDFLKSIFGNLYTDLWTALGFNNSLAVSNLPDELKRMLLAIIAHLTNNPSLEVGTIITAARAQELHDALMNAQHALASQEANVSMAMDDRDAKYNILRKRISNVYQELLMELDPLDPRWKKFGFNIPGADETPEQVTGLKVTLIGPTAAAVKWEASARAAYYRVWTKIHGSEGDYVAMGSPGDLDFTIENLPANSTIDIVVTAVNNGGESSVSDVITITTS